MLRLDHDQTVCFILTRVLEVNLLMLVRLPLRITDDLCHMLMIFCLQTQRSNLQVSLNTTLLAKHLMLQMKSRWVMKKSEFSLASNTSLNMFRFLSQSVGSFRFAADGDIEGMKVITEDKLEGDNAKCLEEESQEEANHPEEKADSVERGRNKN